MKISSGKGRVGDILSWKQPSGLIGTAPKKEATNTRVNKIKKKFLLQMAEVRKTVVMMQQMEAVLKICPFFHMSFGSNK